jgi:O-antigen ligase
VTPWAQLRRVVSVASEVLSAPRMIAAVATAIVGTSVFSHVLRQIIGPPGLVAIIAALSVIAILTIVARWRTIEWRGILPISLLVFLGWAGLSVIWSQYTWLTAGGLAYLAGFTALGLYVALLRDTIQIVRTFGDVLRLALGVSIALEIFSGVLIDAPIEFLGISGHLAGLGPIQGISGSRNQLGILAVMALVTFATEHRTKSTSSLTSFSSLVAAGVVLALTNSQLAAGAALVVLVAAAALYGLRRVTAGRRRFWQFGLLAATVAVAIAAWVSRSVIIRWADASAELNYRLDVWREAWSLISLYPLQGWGWIGTWRDDIPPFILFQNLSARTETSASNALLDIWLQLGLVGLVIFLGLAGLALARSWLLASRQRSVVYAWPALMLVTLLVTALAESSILVEFGWMTFVVCAVKAAEQLSWRRALEAND